MVCINRWKLLTATLLISLAAASEAPDASLPLQSLLESANALLAAGDTSGALNHFDAAIKKDPKNYLTLFKRGATYLSLGRSSQASHSSFSAAVLASFAASSASSSSFSVSACFVAPARR